MNGYQQNNGGYEQNNGGYEQQNFNEKRNVDEDAFGASGNIVSAFDAFPKSKPQYVTRTSGGGKWTVTMIIVSFLLVWSELGRWWRGSEEHTFAVEKGIGRMLQINLDIVINMKCDDLHINVQDAAGDRILAGTMLKRDPTNWITWVDAKGVHKLGRDEHGRLITGEGWTSLADHEEGFGEEHIHDIVRMGRMAAKWGRTPKLIKGTEGDSCRVYGNLDLNKVQGDFHITARGHGYMEFGQHLDHTAFNFSHVISELSFGPFLPSLVNPLDKTVNGAEHHFHKFQYFMSVVPTVYSLGRASSSRSKHVFTNQYAVTEQSAEVREDTIPGIFFKYDIEPILLNVEETRDSIFVFLIKVINVLSGALVAGHWGYALTEWAKEVVGRRRRSASSSGGMLGNSKAGYED